jgi:RND family efflux transporter MFP subunit
MKIRTLVGALLFILVAVVGGNYVLVSLRRSAKPPEPGRPPSLDDAPQRVYGLLEPLGREVFVGPLQSGRVVAVAVREGEDVEVGAVLVRLDDEVEAEALGVAESRVEEAVRRLELTRDDLRRKRLLAEEAVISEFDVTRAELQAKLEEQQIETARAEVALRRVQLGKLTLRSPIDGVASKMDVRVGEQITPQDYGRIVVGRREKQVRLFVETFWLGRIGIDQRFRVEDAETGREVGTGAVESVSPYVGARDFRTEDRLERLDTKYAQVILRLDGPTAAPIGLPVVCTRVGPSRSDSTGRKDGGD